MVSQALVKPNGAGVPDVQRHIPAPIDYVEGLEGFDQSDVQVPRRKIIQLLSQAEGEKGDIIDNLSGESKKEVNAVILRISKGHTLWTPGENRSERPECQSLDGYMGYYADGDGNRQARLCGECQYNPDVNQALWNDDFNPKKDRRCPEGRIFLCVDYDDDSLFLISADGMSVKSVKPIISMFASMRKPVYSAVVKFYSDLKEDGKGTYYILKANRVKMLQGEDLATYQDMSRSMAGVRIADIDEGEASPAGESDNGAPPAYEEDAPEPEVPPEAYASAGGNKKSLF